MAIIWLVGNETSLNQNQKRDRMGVSGGHGRNIKTPVLTARQTPTVKHRFTKTLPSPMAFLTPFSPWGTEVDSTSGGGLLFLLFCTKINQLLGISFCSLSCSLYFFFFFFVFSTFHRSWLQLVNMFLN